MSVVLPTYCRHWQS